MRLEPGLFLDFYLSLTDFPFRRAWGDVGLMTEKVDVTSATISLLAASTQTLSSRRSALGLGKSLHSHAWPLLKKQFDKFLHRPTRLAPDCKEIFRNGF